MVRPHKVVSLFFKGAVLSAALHPSPPLQQENLIKYPNSWLCHLKKRSEKSQRRGRPINLKVKEITAVLSLGTVVVGEINKALKASG